MKNFEKLKTNIQFFADGDGTPPTTETSNEDVNYETLMATLNDLKKNNEELSKQTKSLEESNKKLQKDLADKIMSSNIDNKDKISTKELYEKVLKGGYKSDRDHVVDILELRKRVINETSNKKDIFTPSKNVTRADRDRAEDVANYLQELVDTYQDPVTFKAQFCHKTEFNEMPLLAKKNY